MQIIAKFWFTSTGEINSKPVPYILITDYLHFNLRAQLSSIRYLCKNSRNVINVVKTGSEVQENVS